MGGVTIRDFPGGCPVPISFPMANSRPKSVKVNLTNCHREVCTIVKLSLLMSLDLCDYLVNCYFDNYGHVFIH